MNNKNELLSIGEMAKLTDVGTRALHYYERKNILKPVFIDPDSGYRYYSFNQIFFVNIIKNCVEFGIPIKELAGVVDSNNMDALRNFMVQSIEFIERKSKQLRLAKDTFENVLQRLNFRKEYKVGQIYRREFENKVYYVKSYGQTMSEKNFWFIYDEIEREIYGENIPRLSDINNLDDIISVPDIGCLCQYLHKEETYFGFKEVSKQFAHTNTITIPGGTYFFRQDENSRIKDARKIFKEQLKGKDSFMIIETEEFFLGKTEANQTMYELRLIV